MPPRHCERGGLGVEDAARGEDAEHPPHAGLAGDGVDRRPRRNGRRSWPGSHSLAVLPVSRWPSSESGPLGQQLGRGDAAVAAGGDAVLQRQLILGAAEALGQRGAQPRRPPGRPTSRWTRRAIEPPEPAPAGRSVSPSRDLDPFDRQAQHLGRDLAEDRVGAGADVGHVGLDQRRRRRPASRAPWPRISMLTRAAAAMPRPISHSPSRRWPGCGARALPAEAPRALVQAVAQRAGRVGNACLGVAVGDVAQAQLDRVDAERLGQLVHRRSRAPACPTASPGARTEPAQVRWMRAISCPMRRFVAAIEEMRGLRRRAR